MKTFDRYLIRMIFASFIAVLGIFVGLLLIHQIYKIVEISVKQSLSLEDTLPLFLWAFPPAILYAAPISILVATLVSIGKLAGDNELTALLAAGISRKRIAIAPIVCGFVLGAVTCYNNAVLVPSSYVYFDNVGFGVGIDPIKTLQPGKIGQFKGRLLAVGEIDVERNRFQRLFAVLPSQDLQKAESAGRLVLVAAEGTWRMGDTAVILQLRHGSMETISGISSEKASPRNMSFGSFNWNMSLPSDRSHHPKRLSLSELLERFRDEAGMTRPDHAIELSRRFGTAIISPLFVFCALPILLRARGSVRRAAARGSMVHGFTIYFLYWILTFGAELLVEGYSFPETVLVLPYILLAGLGSLLWIVRR